MPTALPLGHFSVMEFRRYAFGLFLLFQPTIFLFKDTHKSITAADCIQGASIYSMCLIMFQVLYWCKFNPDDCLRKLFPFYRWKWKGIELVQCHRWSIPLNWYWSPFLLICVLLIRYSQALSWSFINFFLLIFFQVLWRSLPLNYPFFCFMFFILFPLFIFSFFLLSSLLCLLLSPSDRKISPPEDWICQISESSGTLGNEGLDSEMRIKCQVEFDYMEKSLLTKAEGINNQNTSTILAYYMFQTGAKRFCLVGKIIN